MLTLYQFPISHYCEKILWALDYKGIPYKTVNLVPGPHVFVIRRLAKSTSVPVVRDGGRVIQDSTAILDYLDQRYPQKLLTPTDANARKEALEWEEYCDSEIGPHLRRFFYSHILPKCKLAKSLLLQRAPAYGPVLYFFIFPLVRILMKKSMNINEASAKRSENRLTGAIERLNAELQNKKYLVGNTFSRADLAAASLLAPLFQPPNHPYHWPDRHLMPNVLQEYWQAHQGSNVARWVHDLYVTSR